MTSMRDSDTQQSKGSEKESVVTAVDILNQHAELEKQAREALPGKFDVCTFELGYIRQALYACKTCTKPDEEPAGMCYSCSIACHSDHELYELFSKRNFRCDCGVGGKFGGHACALSTAVKRAAPSNDKNRYNHNFRGRYCRCDEIYDPEQEEDIMYQCLLCEDWFHERCVGDIPNQIAEFECYICPSCTAEHSILVSTPTPWLSVGLSADNAKVHQWLLHEKPNCITLELPDTDQNETVDIGGKRKSDTHVAESTKRLKQDDDACQRVPLSKEVLGKSHVSLFLKEGWRDHVCRCQKCMEILAKEKIEFILAVEETHEPEEDEDADKSWLEIGMQCLERMNRVQAIESALAFRQLSSQITDFLTVFKDSGEVVTEHDIRQFFAEKRHELETGSSS